ncbi:DUF5372 family protein [Fodinisporobacter ferrooxydans]|uniref:DUF5372 family protein n=1 Tax=Fodinisporobacter ferrooxydans TaxID=2901836 RepID=UPI003D30F99C
MQITQSFSQSLGFLTITHPFHPLHDQSFQILKVKEVNGTRMYSIHTDSGIVCIPESWTDRHLPSIQAISRAPNSPLYLGTLKELIDFIKRKDDLQTRKNIMIDNLSHMEVFS